MLDLELGNYCPHTHMQIHTHTYTSHTYTYIHLTHIHIHIYTSHTHTHTHIHAVVSEYAEFDDEHLETALDEATTLDCLMKMRHVLGEMHTGKGLERYVLFDTATHA